MIEGTLTLREVDAVYQRMIGRELVVFPWYEDALAYGWKEYNMLAGLITGWIDDMPPFIGKSAYLEHIIVLPEAKKKLTVMHSMPAAIAALLRDKGVNRIFLSINHSDPRRARLGVWASWCNYTRYAVADSKDWYILPLTSQGWSTNGKGLAVSAGTYATAASTPSAPSRP